jgi:hypothetical protein
MTHHSVVVLRLRKLKERTGSLISRRHRLIVFEIDWYCTVLTSVIKKRGKIKWTDACLWLMVQLK